MLLAWPTNRDATGNASLDFGHDAGEFFALMLLSIAGVLLVAGANDIILLFLGIELASIPTYIMVTISRPLPDGAGGGRQVLLPRRDGRRHHAVRLQLPLRHDRVDEPDEITPPLAPADGDGAVDGTPLTHAGSCSAS